MPPTIDSLGIVFVLGKAHGKTGYIFVVLRRVLGVGEGEPQAPGEMFRDFPS